MSARHAMSVCTIIGFALAIGLSTAPCEAQLRVMSYNAAQLQGNMSDFRDVLIAAHADDKPGFAIPVSVFVFQEVLSTNVATLQSIVNAAAPPGVMYALATYTNSNEDDFAGAQAMFYRTDLLSEISGAHMDIYTGAGRDADRWGLQLNGYASPHAAMFIYSAHLKASTGFEAERLAGAQALRANADALGSGANVVFTGDFNLYANSEPAYAHLLSPGSGQAFDPIGSGSWAGSGHAHKHTQSPRLNGTAALVGGGLDDRFDFQLPSFELGDGAGLTVLDIPFAYRAFGNDGAHYNTSINAGNNTYYPGQLARSNALAAALYDASDHIPILLDFQIPAKLGGSLPASFGRIIHDADIDLIATVFNPAPVDFALGGDVLQYTASGSLALSGVVAGTVAPLNDFDLASFPLNTSVIGGLTGRITLSSASQAVEPAALILESSGTIVRHCNPSFASTSDVNTVTVIDSIEADTGVHEFEIQVHNFGFDPLQALMDIDAVQVMNAPFEFIGGLASGVGSSPATLTFAFDSDGAEPDLHEAQAVVMVSDEDLPGEAMSTLLIAFEITIAQSSACSADVTGDDMVSVADLLTVISAWGSCDPPPSECRADVNADGHVNVADLLAVISAWGACP